MGNLTYFLWSAILIIYILSPRDLHPSLIDDLVALGMLLYLRYKQSKQKVGRNYSYSDHQHRESVKDNTYNVLTLKEAYNMLNVNPDDSWDTIKKSYKEKITKNHPDKVSHLSPELQEKAQEITIKLNKALEIIKVNKT